MSEVFELPDGTEVGTGLMMPSPVVKSSLPAYETAGVMYSLDELTGADRRKVFEAIKWIINQFQFGSCNGWAAAKALERLIYLVTGIRVELSGEFVYALINGGRDNGSMLDDGMVELMRTGAAKQSLVPRGKIYRHQLSNEAMLDAVNQRAGECYTIESEQEALSASHAGYMLVVAVHADNGFMRLDRDGVAGGGQGPGNHAVLVDGYIKKNGKYLFDMANSWGLTYGDSGRAYLTWERHLAHTRKYHQFYAIRAASELADKDNPPEAK